jgi:CubicO group peptidase (beta-lactamase class C family)
MLKRLVLLLVLVFLLLAMSALAQQENQFWYQNNKTGENGQKTVEPAEVNPRMESDVILTGNCSDYVDISHNLLPISVSGTTVGATNNYGPFPSQPLCWQGYWDASGCAGPDKTYKWTVPTNGRYNISLCGSSYDTGLLLYDFTCPTEPSYPRDFICGNDDFCGYQSELYCLELSAGQQILIVVDGYGSNAGPFQLRISRYQPAPNLGSYITTTMAAEHIPGLSACAISNGEIVWSGNFGHANISQNIDVTDSTLFMLCSISKTFVGVALMQLWEDGLFGLDDDINQYLPWEVHNPLYPDSAITFRMLMTHTSSIIDNWSVINSLITLGGDSPIPLSRFLMNYLIPGGSYYYPTLNYGNYAPGRNWNYCNVGAALAGYLVAKINPDSLSLEDYSQRYIFEPLGMNNSSYFLSNLNIADVATRYSWNGSVYVPYPQDGAPIYPAGWIRTSTNQLARHLITFMQHGQIEGTRILDSTTIELMTTPQIPGWGLFLQTYTFGGRLIWGHPGSWSGARTFMFYCPEENTGAIVLTNGESNFGAQVIMNELFEYAAGHPPTIPEPPTLVEPVNGFISNAPFINFDWNDSPRATLYDIQIDSDSIFAAPVILDTAAVNSQYLNTTELPFGRYFWHVNAYNTFGWSDYSSVWSFNIEHSGPVYVVGDANGDTNFTGLDVTYSVRYFKGGPPPPYSCDCPPHGVWYVAGDVNGSCSFTGLDITYMVRYFKSGPPPIPCPDCLPGRR